MGRLDFVDGERNSFIKEVVYDCGRRKDVLAVLMAKEEAAIGRAMTNIEAVNVGQKDVSP